MPNLTFSNGKSIQINTIAIKYSKFEDADPEWLKRFCIWSLYLHIIANGANPLQQVTLPGVLKTIATYLGSVKFNDMQVHFWFYIINENDSELLESAQIIITNNDHQVLKNMKLEGTFSYES